VRLTLLSDLHANLPALDACLADAQTRGATHHAILGDIVGYGPHPQQVVALGLQMTRDPAIDCSCRRRPAYGL